MEIQVRPLAQELDRQPPQYVRDDMAMQLIDLMGLRFGRLIVVGREKPVRPGAATPWICLCDCGSERNVLSNNLRSGDIQSCGCLRKERVASMAHMASQASARLADETRKQLGLDGLTANMIRQSRIRENHEAAGRPREYPKKSVVFFRDLGICHLCGNPVNPRRWDIDHVIPVSRGGLDTYDNVAVSHPLCNNRKWAHLAIATG